jgi:DNA-binding transcriptional ArsR family regulator
MLDCPDVAIRLQLDPADVVGVRFAISPLWEVTNAVRRLTRHGDGGYHAGWLEDARGAAAAADLSALTAVHPAGAGWVPDFLTPPPRVAHPQVERQIAEVARTPLRRIAAELQRTRGDQTDPAAAAVLDELLADPAAARTRLCAQLREAWRLLIAPAWPRLRDLLDADVAFRARALAAEGIGAAVDGIHERLRFEGGAVAIQHDSRIEHDVAGAGLVLQPSIFSWPSVITVLDPDGPAILVYPARGVATLWREQALDAPVALARLLGGTRARLLADLEEPRSTAVLARRHRLGAPGVSAHLQALYGAGLVVRRRAGHEVRYVRTPLGDALVAGHHGG